jgi:lambda repressor-like predicted transcriptional regulator
MTLMTTPPDPTTPRLPPSRLARVLDAFGISQAELADRSGLTRKTVNDAYHQRPCSHETWIRIAKTIHVPLRTISPETADLLDGLVIE